MKIFFHKTASATSFSANVAYIDGSIKFQLQQYSYSQWILQSFSLSLFMFLLWKQPLVFLETTVSELSVRERKLKVWTKSLKSVQVNQSVAKLLAFSLQLNQKWTASPVSFKNFVYFLRALFNDCFSYKLIFFLAWCKSGTRNLATLGPGTRDLSPPQNLKVGPTTLLKFKSGTPGPPSKFKMLTSLTFL